MRRWLRRLLGYLSIGYDLYSWAGVVMQFGPAAVMTAVAIYSSYVSALPWHWILFCASGVFAFASVATTNALSYAKRTSIFGKLRVDGVSPQIVMADFSSKTCAVFFKIVVRNESDTQPIYAELEDGYVDLQERINSEMVTFKAPFLVNPRSAQAISTGAVKNIAMTQTTAGTIRLRVRYGRRSDKMPFVMFYEMKPVIEFGPVDGDQITLNISDPVTRLETE